jgi:hypothetical protein
MSTTQKPGAIVMPDPKGFKPVTQAADLAIGEVIGVDQEVWAVAKVDCNMRADRLAAERHRLASRGYQKVEGPVTVVGYSNPEVWVMPRSLYEQRRALKGQKIQEAINSGQMTEFAGPRGLVSRIR